MFNTGFGRLLGAALAATTILAGASAASAADFSFDLTGAVADGSGGSFVIGTDTYQFFSLPLSGFTPFTLNSGDTVTLTGLLDGLLTVPASGEQLFAINLLGIDETDFDNDPTNDVTKSLDGSMTFTDGDLAGQTFGGSCSNCLANISGRIPGDAFSFSAFTYNSTVTLSAPYEITAITFSYQLRDAVTAVPEPASWALLIGGFGVSGAALRRSRKPLRALA
ncbi:PEPxxWA-CTERM sorting domain-containing protein [Sphingomonas sp. 1P06PA]|uniref:PEPxxWA-CTERM sorting domain-containing protein n=1 Tax=Sphingomonas sp. 1P06PA TaxID=554121 RepID=UPI0039A4AFB5